MDILREPLKIIESTRDTMQGLNHPISTKNKAKYLTQLLKIGFDTIDFASFVNSTEGSHMTDIEELISLVDFSESKSKLLAIVANQGSFKRAQNFKEINYLGYPLSISETFQKHDVNASILNSYQFIDDMLSEVDEQALIIYISMAFGNPFGDSWSLGLLLKNIQKLVERGINTISIADTTALASPLDIFIVFDKLISEFPETEFGARLHNPSNNWAIKIEAAYDAGCCRFDTAIFGLGTYPFFTDKLIENLATENFMEWVILRNHLLELTPEFDFDEFEKALSLASVIFKV